MSHLITLCVVTALGPPVKDLQGDWHVYEMKIRDAGKDKWRGFTAQWPSGPYLRIKGSCIEVTFCDNTVTKLLSLDPDAFPVGGPTGVRFVDWDGVVYTGTCALNKDGTAVLKLIGNAPVEGLVNTRGTKYLNIYLERPKPPANPFQWFP